MKRAILFVVVVVSAALLSAFVVAPDRVRLPRAKGIETKRPLATFSHWAHDAGQCWRCHPGLFPAAQPITHDGMKRGQACGACHDGRRATSIKRMKCEACHVR